VTALRRLVFGYVVLACGTVLGKLMAAVSEVLLGRSFGPSVLGEYGTWLVLLGYGLVAANAGVDAVGARAVAINPASVARVRSGVRAIRVRGALVLAVASVVLVFLGKPLFVVPLGLAGVALAFRDDWALVALGKEKAVSAAGIVRDLVYFLCIAFLAVPMHAIAVAAVGFLAADVSWAIYTQWTLRKKPAQSAMIESLPRERKPRTQ
jgi:O-antigen/teichoic acid export membrane protein